MERTGERDKEEARRVQENGLVRGENCTSPLVAEGQVLLDASRQVPDPPKPAKQGFLSDQTARQALPFRAGKESANPLAFFPVFAYFPVRRQDMPCQPVERW